ncbi:hypothetical protein DVH05_000006 [Phytophthora capsici]|nr:hypothetical protein DVH05_000006 [Phytophthora capsici]
MDFDDDDSKYRISSLQEYANECVESSHTRQASSRTDVDAPPALAICIMIVGTQGDVQPFVAIAKRLIQDGHRVRLATHAVYRDFVMSHGVEFYPLGGDPKELAAYMVKTGGHLIPLSLEAIQKDVPRNMQMIEEIIQSTWPAVSEADPDGGGPGIPGKPFKAQAIIANPVSYGHIHVAERLGVPLHIMFPQPWVPTTAFPHPLSNMPYTGKPKKVNYMTYKLVDLLMWQGTEGMVNAFRTEVLDLRKIRKGEGGRDILLDLAIPHAFMWSPHLVPKPKDWGKIYDVIGTVTLEESGPSFTPTPELLTFLDHDDRGPIFVGFGSMVLQDPKGVTKMIVEAAAQAGVRVLIQSSWSDMAGDMDVPDSIFFLGSCPHDWLMPRVSAVVHHGGAGTTAAGLLAGKPTFIVPFFGDQPFWGRAVWDAGVGVEPCPISELTTAKLRSAFEKLGSPELRKRAVELRDLMHQEDGAGEAVTCFYRNLPVHLMRCDLNCGRAATLWSQKDKLRLCAECEFVVTSRPENSSTDIVEYTYVDYSARGPDSVFEGASSGVGAMAHAIGSGVKDVFVKPSQGYREEGAKGAVIGLVKGLGGLMISPLVGTIVLADHVATGAYNNSRKENEKRKGSVIKGNNKFLDALGFKSRNVHNGSMSADEVLAGESELSRQIAINLTGKEKELLKNRFYTLMREREGGDQDPGRATFIGSDSVGTNCSTASDDKMRHDRICLQEEAKRWPTTEDSLPKMNICMLVTGSWGEVVQQYVAIGLRLREDGHDVRIATNAVHRDRISRAGLGFHPLGGKTSTMSNFHEYLHQQTQRPKRFLNFIREQDPFSEIEDLRSLVFSLWPACVEVDQMTPGRAFRADAVIAHPALLGQTIVVERLGIPLHCMGDTPLSRTQAFDHVLQSGTELCNPYHYAPANEVSYDVVDKLVWESAKGILNDFRHSLGLTGRSNASNSLAEWRIPHTYLWSPALLPKPRDWRGEITIAGRIMEEHDVEVSNSTDIIRAFAEKNPAAPIIYFALESDIWNPSRVQELLRIVEEGAHSAHVRVIFHLHDDTRGSPSEVDADNVLKINQRFPVKNILPYVKATIHWGGSSITSTCLAAAKPACVLARNSTQLFWGQALALSGAGVQPIELSALTSSSLVRTFEALLDPKRAVCAARLAPTISAPNSLDTAVSAFYKNLPLSGMTCDLDPTRIARVYDSAHGLKLSYEARLVVHQITGGSGSECDLKYKPLKYSRHQPPKFSLRQLDTEPPSLSSSSKHPQVEYMYNPATEEESKVVVGRASPQKRRTSLLRGQSMALKVVEVPRFWSSPEEQAKCTAQINAQYEQALKERVDSS